MEYNTLSTLGRSLSTICSIFFHVSISLQVGIHVKVRLSIFKFSQIPWKRDPQCKVLLLLPFFMFPSLYEALKIALLRGTCLINFTASLWLRLLLGNMLRGEAIAGQVGQATMLKKIQNRNFTWFKGTFIVLMLDSIMGLAALWIRHWVLSMVVYVPPFPRPSIAY